MREIKVEQGGAEWHGERRGRITASAAEFLVRRTEASWRTLAKLVGGERRDIDNVASIQWGRKHEPLARAEAAFWLMADIALVGFMVDDELDYVGCSPDGHFWELDEGLEIKCPHNPKNHLAAAGGMPSEHIPQTQFQMMVTGWRAVQFVSYDPRQPVETRTFIHRIPRNEKYIADMRQACRDFWAYYTGDRTMPELQQAGRVSGKRARGAPLVMEDIF